MCRQLCVLYAPSSLDLRRNLWGRPLILMIYRKRLSGFIWLITWSHQSLNPCLNTTLHLLSHQPVTHIMKTTIFKVFSQIPKKKILPVCTMSQIIKEA